MNRRKLLLLSFVLVSTFAMLALVFVGFASADSWWGKGFRDKEWVLSHGGTIIRFEIENTSGKDNEYKAVMYDDDGDYVEKEFGTKAYFDDAKDGKYRIKAYRVKGGVIDKTTHKGGKEFASIKVTAHPGETMKIKFDYKKKKAKMTTDYVKPIPKPVVKPAPTVAPEPEPAVEVQKEEVGLTETPVVGTEEVALVWGDKNSFADITEYFFHTEAMANVSTQQTFIKQADSPQRLEVAEEKPDNFFERIWTAVTIFFSFNSKSITP